MMLGSSKNGLNASNMAASSSSSLSRVSTHSMLRQGVPGMWPPGVKSSCSPRLSSPQYSEKQMTVPLAHGDSLVTSMYDTSVSAPKTRLGLRCARSTSMSATRRASAADPTTCTFSCSFVICARSAGSVSSSASDSALANPMGGRPELPLAPVRSLSGTVAAGMSCGCPAGTAGSASAASSQRSLSLNCVCGSSSAGSATAADICTEGSCRCCTGVEPF
mmetsp:Transcript_19278/g.58213  ORF Transcript_19278/g.58213 Transcript_19278/m.58213 type:complete len:219 (-) Transcript_19278:1003-1659(-)